MNFQGLEKKLNFQFNNHAFLLRALTHRSYLNESTEPGLESNERLEFLGDAVLELVISEWLYELFPTSPEGVLTNLRSTLVRTESLAQIAQQAVVGEYLLMSRGERESGGRANPSLLANTIEAIIGAIYLDQGISPARNFIRQRFEPLLKKIARSGEFKDPKSLLQERLQATLKEAPNYRLLKEIGPDHAKTFTVGVYFQKAIIGRGSGKSLKTAEESAAREALKKNKLFDTINRAKT